jgi:TolA-binding protein
MIKNCRFILHFCIQRSRKIGFIICLVGFWFPTLANAQSVGIITQEQKDLEFADGLYQRKLYENSARQYSEFMMKYPASEHRELCLFRQSESYYQLATQQQEQKPVQAKVTLLKAQGLFYDFINSYKNSERIHEAFIRHGEISYKLDAAEKALPSLGRVIQESKDPNLLESALFYAARSHDVLGQWLDAEKRYRQVRASYPKGEYAAFSTYLLAELLAKRNQADEANALLLDIWSNPQNYNIPKSSSLIEDAKLRSAQILYQTDRFEDASKAYLAYVREHPTGENAAKARYGAAWSEYQQRNFDRALEIANELHKESLPSDLLAGIVFLQGTCSYERKLFEDAILYFREVIADPNAGEYRNRAWYQLAWSYYLTNHYERARIEANNLLQFGLETSMASNTQFLIAQTHAQEEHYTDAIKALQLSLQLDDTADYSEDALYLLADLQYRIKQYASAAKNFDRFYQNYTTSERREDALVWAAHSRFADKDFAAAIQTADLLLKSYPDVKIRNEILYRKSLAHYQRKEYENAIKTLDAILNDSKQKTWKAEALYWQGYIYEILKEMKQAAAKYGDLLKQYPTFKNREEVRLRKALCDYHNKEHGVAFEGFYSVLFTERGTKLPAEILFWMILTADNKKNHEDALDIIHRILEIYQDLSIRERATIALGNQLLELQRWKEANQVSDDFLQQYPSSLFLPEMYWIRGKSFEKLGNDTSALEWYEKSLLEMQKLTNPDHAFEATLFTDRGRLLYRMDRIGDALESFLRVAIIYDHPQKTPESMYYAVKCHIQLNENDAAKSLLSELRKRYSQSEWAIKAKSDFVFPEDNTDKSITPQSSDSSEDDTKQ